MSEHTQQRMGFGDLADKLLLLLLTGLIAWLCNATMNLNKQVTKLVAQSEYAQRDNDSLRADLNSLRLHDSIVDAQIQDLRDQHYKHGWR